MVVPSFSKVIVSSLRRSNATIRCYARPAKRIELEKPIVELDGDEMAHVLWNTIKEKLILPYLKMDNIYSDLSLSHRNETEDQVTNRRSPRHFEAPRGHQVRHHHAHPQPHGRVPSHQDVGVSQRPVCTPGRRNTVSTVHELGATIRNILGGMVFREPIMCHSIPRHVPGWTNPICVGRHAHADQYKAQDFTLQGPCTFKLVYRAEDGNEVVETVHEFVEGGGVALGMYNTDKSIRDFAHASFMMDLKKNWPLYMSTKNTILKRYGGRFKDIFNEIYLKDYKQKFDAAGIWYEHKLIDTMVSAAQHVFLFCISLNNNF